MVISYGTSPLSEPELLTIVNDNFDLRPGVLIRDLGLKNPIYKETAKNGHFGHERFPWEQVKELQIRPEFAAKLKARFLGCGSPAAGDASQINGTA